MTKSRALLHFIFVREFKFILKLRSFFTPGAFAVPTPPEPAITSTHHRPWVLLALMLFMMLAAMDVTIVSTAVPQVVADLGDFSLFTWVFSIYLLAQTVSIPIYGKLADLYGRKPILLAGSLIFLAASAAAAAAWNMPALIFFRGIQGLGAGAMMATISTLAGDLYTVRERAKIQGFLSSVWGIAAITGPLLGGAFAEYISWRWIFLVNLPIGALAISFLLLFLHEQVTPKVKKVDYLGSAAILAAVSSLILALLEGGRSWPWLSLTSAAMFVLVLVLTAFAVWTQRRAAEPILPGWLWHHRALAGANLAMIGMGFMVMGPIAYLPTFAQSVYDLNAIMAGFVLAAMSLSWPTASALSGLLYLRIGFRNTALIGSIIICGAASYFLLLPYQTPVWTLVVAQIAIGAGFGLMSTSTLVGAQSSVDWHRRGVVTGANMFSRFLGQSLGVAVFGAIFNASVLARLTQPHSALAELNNKIDLDLAMTALQSDAYSPEVIRFLRHSIYAATQNLYTGLLIMAVLTLIIVLLSPKRFDRLHHEPALENNDRVNKAIK